MSLLDEVYWTDNDTSMKQMWAVLASGTHTWTRVNKYQSLVIADGVHLYRTGISVKPDDYVTRQQISFNVQFAMAPVLSSSGYHRIDFGLMSHYESGGVTYYDMATFVLERSSGTYYISAAHTIVNSSSWTYSISSIGSSSSPVLSGLQTFEINVVSAGVSTCANDISIYLDGVKKSTLFVNGSNFNPIANGFQPFIRSISGMAGQQVPIYKVTAS